MTSPSPNPENLHQLEPTPPETKRYQRQKLAGTIGSMVLSVACFTVVALIFGPRINQMVESVVGSNRWLRLIGLAFVYAAGLELLTLPIDFWSGFILEHRYQLSQQTFLAWAWRQIK